MPSISDQFSVVSQAISVVSQAISVETSNRVSADNALSNRISALASGVSGRTTGALSVRGMQSIVDALSSRISQAGGGAASVTSTEVSAVSATAAGSISVLSQQVSVLSAKLNGLSGIQVRTRGAVTTISAATLTIIPSLSLSCAAGALYLIDGALVWQGATSGGFAFGLSLPPLAAAGGFIETFFQSVATSAGYSAFPMSAFAGGTTQIASVSIATINQVRGLEFRGHINTSAAGTVHLMGRASVAGGGLVVDGGWIRAWKVT